MSDYPHLQNARVLIVDDVAEWREIARSAFADAACDLHEATNGEEALRVLHQAKTRGAPFDLVLLDLTMPTMNGFRVLKQMRSTPRLRCMPVVVTTVESAPDDVSQCKEHKVSGYLLKPYKRDRLLREADNAIAQARGKGT